VNCFVASLTVSLHEKAGSSTYICRWKRSLAIVPVGRPRNAANLPQAMGAEPLPKTRQLNTQNLLSMNATVKRFSMLLRGIWWNASEMSMPKSHECIERGLGEIPRAVDV
jgi:hypothetical protein